jgi:hypothetical protein
MIEFFSLDIRERYQFQDFVKSNRETAEEFRHTVKKMINSEERTKERFPDRNRQDNCSDDPRGNCARIVRVQVRSTLFVSLEQQNQQSSSSVFLSQQTSEQYFQPQ